MPPILSTHRPRVVRRRFFWVLLLLVCLAAGSVPLLSGATDGTVGLPAADGYWLLAPNGEVYPFGDAAFFGSMGAIALSKPIVGMASTPSGQGYWLVASDGGIFSFGDARFFGSTGAIALNKPIVGMASTPSGQGYWLVASDGGIFSFGDATFFGSTALLGEQVVAMVPSILGRGYREVTTTGRVHVFGDSPDLGSRGGLSQRVVGAAAQGRASAPVVDPGAPIGTSPLVSPASKGRPNILFILLDDMREQGVMDVPEVLPRTKQWLVQGGTTFAEGYATTSLCCPERATIWSGRLPHNHQVVDNDTGDNLDREWISPRYLQDAGYQTSLVGKFITNWLGRYEPPHFDQFSVMQGGYVDQRFMVKDLGEAGHHSEKAAYSTDFIADRAVEYIEGYEANDDQPWFMQVSPHAPHDNKVEGEDGCDLDALYDWPERHDGLPIPAWKPTPPVSIEGGNTAEKLDKVNYLRNKDFTERCGEITYEGHMRTLMAADEMVDKVMTTLEAKGELDNTLVIFTSDNGYNWSDRGVTSKGLPYAEDVKVPFLVRWDGVFPAGGVDYRPVGGEDFLPTYLEAAQY
ncbi:MAG: sulfatase-like hydrolase/transferase, partial [Acidimicrobiia bacterium]